MSTETIGAVIDITQSVAIIALMIMTMTLKR